MDPAGLTDKEEKITLTYREFLGKVREAFDRHCEAIKEEATLKLAGIPEENTEARQKVIDEQNAQLDRTLMELKQLLAQKEAEVRAELEAIAEEREQGDFSIDDELEQIEESGEKHAA